MNATVIHVEQKAAQLFTGHQLPESRLKTVKATWGGAAEASRWRLHKALPDPPQAPILDSADGTASHASQLLLQTHWASPVMACAYLCQPSCTGGTQLCEGSGIF